MLPPIDESPNTKFRLLEYASKSQIDTIFVVNLSALYWFDSHCKISFDFHCFLCLSNSWGGICVIDDAVIIQALNSYDRTFSNIEIISLLG
jgi:hypothetical protein